jgi:hypothetical protein
MELNGGPVTVTTKKGSRAKGKFVVANGNQTFLSGSAFFLFFCIFSLYPARAWSSQPITTTSSLLQQQQQQQEATTTRSNNNKKQQQQEATTTRDAQDDNYKRTTE